MIRAQTLIHSLCGPAMLVSTSVMAAPADVRVIRIAELAIDPARLEQYKAILKVEIETSVRVEPGVLSLSAVALKQDPSHVRLLEVYANQSAYEAHIRSPHFIKYKTGTASMVLSLTLLETDPILLCAKQATAPTRHC